MEEFRELPRYVCHKEVHALKILDITDPNSATDGSRQLLHKGYPPTIVDRNYMLKHEPQIGGYYVVYEDGYKSYSPAKAFEEGYTIALGDETLIDDISGIL